MIYIKWFFHQFYGMHKNFGLMLSASCLFLILLSGIIKWNMPVDPNHPIRCVYPKSPIYAAGNPVPIGYIEDHAHSSSLDLDGHPFAIWILFAIGIGLFPLAHLTAYYSMRNFCIGGYRWKILGDEKRTNILHFEGFKENYK